MDPTIANRNLDPPRQRVVLRGLVPAVLAHVLLGVALAASLDWKRGSDAPSLASFDAQGGAVAAAGGSGPTAAAGRDGMTAAASGGAPAAAMGSGAADANDTSRMGAAAAPVPAWPSAAVSDGAAGKPAPATEQARTRVATLDAKAAARTPASRHAEGDDPRTQPSFDCARARSATERLICRDPQLSRLDRELGRIHAQAKRAAPDPGEFKRENDEEWRLREAVCRDKDCLLEWYAHRRQQLQERLARR